MKNIHSIWVIILFVIAGCKEPGIPNDELITVDVTANYPKKELVLQDIMDVEYIPLETNDDFLCEGSIQAVGKNIIIAKNRRNDGNIFIFNRKGKALRKINRKGQGNEEYTGIRQIMLDEKNNQMFVNDMYAKQILVYDLEGNFKQKLSLKGDFLFDEIYNFDQNNLIGHDDFQGNSGQSFMFISKQDGSITKEIQIPFNEKKSIVVTTPKDEAGRYFAYTPPSVCPLMPYFNDYILTEISADTLYKYSPDHTMKPFIARTPSVQSTNPETFLLPSMLTDRYYFMEKIVKNISFPSVNIVYDKQEKALFRYKVYNGDYTNEKEAYLKSQRHLSSDIAAWQYLEAPELVEAYKKGQLKGKLKEIAANLDEESNPVIMLIKHKK